MMLIVEAQDKTIDKRCTEQGFRYFETLREKLAECKISCEGVNYSVRRGRNQQQAEIRKTTLETKAFKWIIGNKSNNKQVIDN